MIFFCPLYSKRLESLMNEWKMKIIISQEQNFIEECSRIFFFYYRFGRRGTIFFPRWAACSCDIRDVKIMNQIASVQTLLIFDFLENVAKFFTMLNFQITLDRYLFQHTASRRAWNTLNSQSKERKRRRLSRRFIRSTTCDLIKIYIADLKTLARKSKKSIFQEMKKMFRKYVRFNPRSLSIDFPDTS